MTDPLTAAATATFIPGMADRLDENNPVDKYLDRTIQAEVKLTGIIAGNRVRRAVDGRR